MRIRIGKEYLTTVADSIAFYGDSGAVGWEDRRVEISEPADSPPTPDQLGEAAYRYISDPEEQKKRITAGWMPRGTISFESNIDHSPTARVFVEKRRVLSIGSIAVPLPGRRIESETHLMVV